MVLGVLDHTGTLDLSSVQKIVAIFGTWALVVVADWATTRERPDHAPAEEAIEASRQTGSASRRGEGPTLAPAAAMSGPPISADPETEPPVSEEEELPEPPVSADEPPSADPAEDSEDSDDGGESKP